MEIWDGLVNLWQNAGAALHGELKPHVPIVQEPMIQDLVYCLRYYAKVPRQI